MVNQLTKWMKIEFDNETNQYSVFNDLTPGIYGVWDTKEESIKEYISGLEDFIYVNFNIKNESKTFA